MKRYLDKEFDYTKLTKQELRDIMSENNVADIPPPTVLKITLLKKYKKHIYDRIDELKKQYENFSSENIFQNDSKKTEDEQLNSKTFVRNSTMDDKNMSEMKSYSKTFNVVNRPKDFSEKEDVNKIPAEEIDESKIRIKDRTEQPSVKKTSENPPIGSRTMGMCSEVKGVVKRIDSFSVVKISINIALAVLILYLKFLIPYCDDGVYLCIPLPKNAYLASEEIYDEEKEENVVRKTIKCHEGFDLKTWRLITHCTPSNRISKYIKELEYIEGDKILGIKADYRRLEEVALNTEEKNKIRYSRRVLIEGDKIIGKRPRYRITSIVRYGLKRMIVIFCIVGAFYVLFRYYKARKYRREKAESVSAEILGVLRKQLLLSNNSTLFRPFILEQQLIDVYNLDSNVWTVVKNILESNSNIETVYYDQHKAWKWIGPIIDMDELNK